MTDTDIDTAAEVREDPYDELDGSPIPEQVLGAAFPALNVFHGKLMAEGGPRGLIAPRDIHILWERHILNSAQSCRPRCGEIHCRCRQWRRFPGIGGCRMPARVFVHVD